MRDRVWRDRGTLELCEGGGVEVKLKCGPRRWCLGPACCWGLTAPREPSDYETREGLLGTGQSLLRPRGASSLVRSKDTVSGRNRPASLSSFWVGI